MKWAYKSPNTNVLAKKVHVVVLFACDHVACERGDREEMQKKPKGRNVTNVGDKNTEKMFEVIKTNKGKAEGFAKTKT
jgi:hypothetical protein